MKTSIPTKIGETKVYLYNVWTLKSINYHFICPWFSVSNKAGRVSIKEFRKIVRSRARKIYLGDKTNFYVNHGFKTYSQFLDYLYRQYEVVKMGHYLVQSSDYVYKDVYNTISNHRI